MCHMGSFTRFGIFRNPPTQIGTRLFTRRPVMTRIRRNVTLFSICNTALVKMRRAGDTRDTQVGSWITCSPREKANPSSSQWSSGAIHLLEARVGQRIPLLHQRRQAERITLRLQEDVPP